MQDGVLTGVSILVVEDEPLLRRQMTAHLQRAEADVVAAENLQLARKVIAEQDFAVALLDVNLPDGRGTDLLKEKAFPSSTAVIVMTADGGVAGAIEAIQLGALDYLQKPVDPAALTLVIARARRVRQAARAEEHQRETRAEEGFFFGKSLAGMESLLNKIITADTRMEQHLPPVLIEGETGTGKTTIARWLHEHGPRASQPWIEVNCSALPETLAESELFGHERGAFTDARTARMGLFEAASGGTLFLDELPSLSLATQAKILKAIEDHQIRRVGSNKAITIDTRVIAATNRNLKEAITAGRFREDLYHRLDLFRVTMLPLRERREDLSALAEKLIARICRRHRFAAKKLTPAGQARLLAHAWPGNVRELAHELERALVFEDGRELELAHLAPLTDAKGGAINPNDWFNEQFRFAPEGFQLEDAINRLINHALKQTNQNVSAAARLLGVSRDYVRYRLDGGKSSKPAGE